MKKITTHSKSGLFLMEMIFVLLFLGLTCGVCVRLFAASYTARLKAREMDHIQELVTSAGEILEGTDGTAKSFLALMPEGDNAEDCANIGHVCYYFDKQWQAVSSENYVYKMDVALSLSATIKSAEVEFSKVSGQNEEKTLYTQTIRFPVSGETKEADS